MAKIQYQDKQTATNKFKPAPNEIFTASDANEVKQAVNFLYNNMNGGGGENPGIIFRVQSLSGLELNFIPNADALIRFSFSSIDTFSDLPTGNGSVVVTVGTKTVISTVIPQGENTINLKDKLSDGINNVKVKITDAFGSVKSIDYVANLIKLGVKTTYEVTTINTGAIAFRYTPIGTTLKTVHFSLDGVELPSVETIVNNSQLTLNLPAQAHGVHRLEVYVTAVLNGAESRSNTLAVDLVCVEAGNPTTLIAVDFQLQSIEQYTPFQVPFFVYNPLNINSTVHLKASGTTVSTLTVNRTKQIWNYKPTIVGTLPLQIESNGSTNTFEINVTPSQVNVQAETNDLQLFLSSQNRNNNEVNKNQWKFQAIEAVLSGFNYVTDGWIVDNFGSTCLRVSNGATVTIPIHPFTSSIRESGKTIEFEFENTEVRNYDAIVASCFIDGIGFQIKANEILFSSEQTSMYSKFKEDERVRISIVLNKTNDDRLLYIFVNGILSGVRQYPLLDNFVQSAPQNITIGSNDCNINLYTLRVYNNNLNQNQILNNFIADLDDVSKKVAVFQRNDVFDGLGAVNFDKTLNLVPCMVITGQLPTFKGDKQVCTIDYVNKQDATMSFTGGGTVDVQGTSSQYYPRKNFKIKFTGFTNSTGTTSTKYALRQGYIPEKTFTFKADFAESSGTHNTGLSRIIHYLLTTLNIKTPPMVTNPKVRTTIDGFPIIIYHRATADAPLEFVGKYNFNHDKGDEATFGFTEGTQCWEVTNNTSDNTLFLGSDFTSLDEEGNPLWLSDYEARYPEDNLDVTLLSAMQSWVVSTIGDIPKFRAEASTYFNVPMLLFYYVMTEMFAMVDQRGKNVMFAFFDGKCYPIFYDSDTILGLNNEGDLKFGYEVEYHDSYGSGNVWNAENSTLFNNIEQAFPTEIADMYSSIRNVLTYDLALKYFNQDQSDKWGEAIFNEDARYKYILPLLEDNQGTYLYAAQGARAEHRKWWIANRFKYMDSKYNSATFQTDYATLRLYTPENAPAVTPNADFLLTAFGDGYSRVKFGSYNVKGKLQKNNTTLMKAPDITFNDTETIVYGMSAIKSLGSLVAKYAGTLDVTRATKLVDLVVGSTDAGYRNSNLVSLAVGNNKLLKKIDVSNCTSLIQPLDLSNCPAIQEVYAKGSAISTVILPEGGNVSTLHLPKITSLVLKNQLVLENDGIEIESLNNLTTVIIEDCPNLDLGELIPKFNTVSRIRLIDVDGTSDYSLDFYYLNLAKGVNENGDVTENAVVQGKWHFVNAFIEDLDVFAEKYPNLEVTYDNLLVELPFENQQIKDALEAKFGTLTLTNVQSITSLDGVFEGLSLPDHVNFNEFRYFTNVTTLNKYDIPSFEAQYYSFDSLTFPRSLHTIDNDLKICARTIIGLEYIKFIGRASFGFPDSRCTLFQNMPVVKFPNLEELIVGSTHTDYQSAILMNNPDVNFILDLSDSKLVSISENFIGHKNTLYGIVCDDILLPTTLKTIGINGLYLDVDGDNRPIKLPESVETIYQEGISNKVDLTKPPFAVTMPTNLRVLGNQSLIGWEIYRVIIKEGIQELKSQIFSPNYTKEIVLLSTVPPVVSPTLLYAGQKVFVPNDSLTAYKTASNWSALEDKIFPMSELPVLPTSWS